MCAGPSVPSGYSVASIHGFVEELVVNDDPEYQVKHNILTQHIVSYTLPLQWIDKIRTPRASNEARQRLFSRLSGTYPLRGGGVAAVIVVTFNR